MSQETIYNLLKKKDRWMTVKEIVSILKINHQSVNSSLKRLEKHGDILRKNVKNSKPNGAGFAAYEWRVEII